MDQVYELGATGILVQDISLINILKTNYPNLEIHCSTQMNINNSLAIDFVKSLGSNRVVLPREMTIDRIKDVRIKTDLELEVFIHGALCVGYSGLCFDSILLDEKSANRGRCSQYCRMEQRIINTKTGKLIRSGHPLNLRDLNNVDNVEEYINMGIDSIKIEGRLKQADYVGLVTKAYYNALTGGKSINLKNVYNREFSNGRILNVNGEKLVNLDRPNNSGIEIGKITGVQKNNDKGMMYYKYKLIIETNVELNKQDNIRYLNNNYETGETVERFEKIEEGYVIYSKCNVDIGTIVYRTQNVKILNKN